MKIYNFLLLFLLMGSVACAQNESKTSASAQLTKEQQKELDRIEKGDTAAAPALDANEQETPASEEDIAATVEEFAGSGKYLYKMTKVTEGKKTYNVADIDDVSKIYKESFNKDNCFGVISKREYRLYVYEVVGKDTVLVAHYPVCYARNTGDKTRTGDMCTPECSLGKPFYIKQIQDASSWKHDFHDGRGSIPAYGNYFMRLDLSKSDCHVPSNRSIGIHGCGGNEASVPGQDSEGCIRLRDADIKSFRSNFAHVGMKIVLKAFSKDKYPFEKRAEKNCKNYSAPKPGYKKH